MTSRISPSARPATPVIPTASAPHTTPTGTQQPSGAAGWQPKAGAAPLSEAQRARRLGALYGAGGARSIEQAMKAHADSLERTGVGIYYGDKSAFRALSGAARDASLNAALKPGQTAPKVMKESSCIAWALEHVGAAYRSAGKGDRWKEIYRTVTRNGAKGTDLAKELKKDGWKAIYWNPDTRKASDNDGEHTFTAAQVRAGKGYYGIAVDGSILNYRPTEGSGTTKSTAGIDALKQVPFWFGLARGGKHTFVGRGENLNEFHWREEPTSSKPFSEKSLEVFSWNSGLLMVPPGTWPTK